MQGIGNQSDTKNQLNNDGHTCHQKREVEAEEMVAVDINLELVHIDNLQDGRSDKDKSEQDFHEDGNYAEYFVHRKKKGTRVGMCLHLLANESINSMAVHL